MRQRNKIPLACFAKQTLINKQSFFFCCEPEETGSLEFNGEEKTKGRKSDQCKRADVLEWKTIIGNIYDGNIFVS